MALCDLKGQRLTEIQVHPQTGATRFAFDLDTVLEVRRMNRRSKDELWIIYGRDGYERSVRAGGRFCREKLNGEDKRDRSNIDAPNCG